MQIVTCSSCQNFIPDQIGNGQGIGQCKSFEEYKDVLKAKDSPLRKYLEAIERAEVKLGIIPMEGERTYQAAISEYRKNV
jgi:hypothetical protein